LRKEQKKPSQKKYKSKTFQDLDVDLNAISHHDETTELEEMVAMPESPVAFFLQTGNSFHTPSYFKVSLLFFFQP
jgi:hypothetical protein